MNTQRETMTETNSAAIRARFAELTANATSRVALDRLASSGLLRQMCAEFTADGDMDRILYEWDAVKLGVSQDTDQY